MKTVCCFLVILLARQATCGIIRNPPAFSKPVYSDSYLPAAMQVIFHAVEQLKTRQAEESTQSSTTLTNVSTSPISQPAQDEATTVQQSSTMTGSATTESMDEVKEEAQEENTNEPSKDQVEVSKEEETVNDKLEEPPKDKVEETSESVMDEVPMDKIKEPSKDKAEESSKDEMEDASNDKIEVPLNVEETLQNEKEESSNNEMIGTNVGTSNSNNEETSESVEYSEESMKDPPRHEELPEVNEEAPEANYATPEANYESPEDEHAVQETNHEASEENHESNNLSSTITETKLEATTESGSNADSATTASNVEKEKEKGKEPTVDSVVQGVYEILKPTTSKFVDEDAGPSEESKSVVGVSLVTMDNIEDEDDETRFTRLGEKVTQVPRPSLSSYLRRSNVPPSPTLQQLANLYDSLSKDARKQGFGKYTGYSDDVLGTLRTSAEGGIGPQLKKILDKLLERNELTRDDAKTRTSQTVRDLDNPSSTLSKELRPLLPLRYSP